MLPVKSLRPPFSNSHNIFYTEDFNYSNESAIPVAVLDSQPPLVTVRGVLEELNTPDFLQYDLDLGRINKLHHHLWMAGEPIHARPFHKLKHSGLRVRPTHQHDLHLLSYESSIFLKPLPEWLLNYQFWEQGLCSDEELHKRACGLLVSWIWLIQSPLDLRMANQEDFGLLPPQLSWKHWKAIVRDVQHYIDFHTLDQVNKRYHYGELNLSRINLLFRMKFFKPYLYDRDRSNSFFLRRFGWIGIAFLFFQTILAAMQVGFSVDPLSSSYAFSRSSFGFTAFSLITAGVLFAIWGLICIRYGAVFLGSFFASFFLKGYQERRRKAMLSMTSMA
ncbi:hypothetical protein K432DRAFT_9025 [Lepidopterella palustris CBS 459.81]|uniref:Uncharacterized protein n=1 Tax=Lepidopterella palustris CBS 459.81 TaxID=1314670 RepID=A0A8E2DWZ6_9PEZI|nr:hypothetical protein K432DRAFT_9025 [Lepidopterella palustris CBS 459.81]